MDFGADCLGWVSGWRVWLVLGGITEVNSTMSSTPGGIMYFARANGRRSNVSTIHGKC